MKARCPHCGKTYQLKDSMVGKQATCKSCQSSFLIKADLPDGDVSNQRVGQSSRQRVAVPDRKIKRRKSSKMDRDENQVSRKEARSINRKSAERQRRLKELLEGFQEDFRRPRVSIMYRLTALFVTGVMLALPIVYLGFVFLIGALTWWHVSTNHVWIANVPGGRAKFFVAMLYGIFALGGLMWVISLAIPLFVGWGRDEDDEGRGISRIDEPLLYVFAERLAEVVGAPRPTRIYLTLDVNASARVQTGMFGLWRKGFILTLGVPLVRGLSLPELAGVIAHEFGHFSQGGGLFLDRIIRRVNTWFEVAVFYEGPIDALIEGLTEDSDEGSILLALIGFLLWGLVGLGRGVLWLLMMFGHMVSSRLMHQMEFDADRYEIALGGSEIFEQTTHRIIELTIANELALDFAFNSLSANHSFDDLPAFVDAISKESRTIQKKAKKIIEKEKPSWFSTHPPIRSRIARANKMNHPGAFKTELPGDALFTDFKSECKKLTLILYKLRYGFGFDESKLISSKKLANTFLETMGHRRVREK